MNQSTNRVPVPTLERMATYLACLQELDARGVETVSSAEIEKLTDVNAAQFRKDLSYFGEFGRPGIGYAPRNRPGTAQARQLRGIAPPARVSRAAHL